MKHLAAMERPMNGAGKASSEAGELVSFSYLAPHAQTVYLIGDFNAWNHTSHPMQRQINGSWFLQVPLGRGRHHYQFLVDGEPVLDPNAMYFPLGAQHEFVSFIALD
jgi:1,4-alpha-glucan branching enzyme